MKKTVIVYGLVGGLICGGTLGISGIMNSGSLNFENGMYFGFASMILAAVVICFGMASYKKNHTDGNISFGKAFKIGVLTTLIASSIYVFTWMAMYRTAFAGFGEKYATYQIESMKKMGKSAAEIQEFSVKTRESMELYDNNAMYRVAVTYMEILPIQLVVVLIASIIISRKKKNRQEFSFNQK